MAKKVLIVGAGVSGCTCAYLLKKKGYDITIIDKEHGVGGMSRTYYYDGHPFEFGPHVWFWPHKEANDVIQELTGGRLYDVDRKLYSRNHTGMWRYPLHMDDIVSMPEADAILQELKTHRDKNMDLRAGTLPKFGECSFEKYFVAAVGPTLYERFMAQYTHKMWGIPGHELGTKMVWADRIKDHYTDKPYDPIKFEDHSLGRGQPNWYPMDGWNVVWEKMVEGCELVFGYSVHSTGVGVLVAKNRSVAKGFEAVTMFHARDYDHVIWTLHSDLFFGDAHVLPAMGRLVVPLLVPVSDVYKGIESIHYSDSSPLTRTTDMDTITRYKGTPVQQAAGVKPYSLLLLEVPLNNAASLPTNVNQAQYYQPRCYNHQTDKAIAQHQTFVELAEKAVPNIIFCGRHANFKYYGMPETVTNAINMVSERF